MIEPLSMMSSPPDTVVLSATPALRMSRKPKACSVIPVIVPPTTSTDAPPVPELPTIAPPIAAPEIRACAPGPITRPDATPPTSMSSSPPLLTVVLRAVPPEDTVS